MMPLFKIQMPASAGGFFASIMTIAAFDLYDFSEALHEIFMIPPTGSMSSNFETIGFESSYFLVNMGSMLLFYIFYLLLLAVILPLLSISDSCQSKRKKLSKKLKWNSLITLMNESYQIVVVCLLINLQIFSLESGGLATMSILCATFVVASIVLPLVFFI